MQGIKALKVSEIKKNKMIMYLFLTDKWRQKFLVDLARNQKSSLNWMYFY